MRRRLAQDTAHPQYGAVAAVSQPDRAEVLAALERVADPKSGKGLPSAGLVQGLVVSEARAGFILEVARADVALYAPVRDAAEAALLAVAGVERAQVVLTAASAGAPGPARGHAAA